MASQSVTLPPFLRNFSVEGRVALVTGGSGGIGIGVCTALAESGADIVSLQLPTEPTDVQTAVEKVGKKCHIYHFDLNQLDTIPPVMEKVMSTHNPSIIINCAGIIMKGETTEFPIEGFEKVIRVNTTASIVVAREAVKSWLKQEKLPFARKIINFASISSFQGNLENIAYVASKGAVLNMTRGMSNEWAPHGITVNCVAPGYTKSRMTEKTYTNEAYNEQLYKKLPAQRWGEPKDLGAACVYLASPASDYVSGTCLVVDGGYLGGLP
ncbi:hypothetical protein FE257_006664 [Aspergillus nanangensis]|uniref:2-deoxy-D-gluconate 3-dehydrogenase n=1 Tax=Aspergillus nanangensis TaxID=2582783 RepID=A0AAD4CNW0_ASPNN|nr:hypothetical protein FE257_006664 [Aspergillus nanangensis]